MQIHEAYGSSDFLESFEMFFENVVLYITAIAVAAESEYFDFTSREVPLYPLIYL